MSSPPTIAVTAAAPAGMTQTIGTIASPGRFTFTGGTILNYAGGVRLCAATDGASGGNLGGGQNQAVSRLKVILDGDAICFRTLAATSAHGLRFIVDGQYVSLATTAPSFGGGYSNFVTLTFATRATREIWVEGSVAEFGVYSVLLKQSDTIRPTPPGRSMVVLGDSWTAMIASGGSMVENDCFAQVLGECFGIHDLRASGVGQQGYLGVSAAGWKLRDRITVDVPTTVDVVVVAMGFNDKSANQAALQTEVGTTLAAIRARAPLALVIVLGVPAGTTGPDAQTTTCEATINTAFTAWADRNAVFVPCSSAAAGSMLFGTGKATSPTGVGNADLYMGADGAHPYDSTAHIYIGRWWADQIMAAAAAQLTV